MDAYENLAVFIDGVLLIALRPDYKKWEPLRKRWLLAQSFAAKVKKCAPLRAYALRDGGWHKALRPKYRNVDR